MVDPLKLANSEPMITALRERHFWSKVGVVMVIVCGSETG